MALLKGFLQLVGAGTECILLNQTQNQTQYHCQWAADPRAEHQESSGFGGDTLMCWKWSEEVRQFSKAVFNINLDNLLHLQNKDCPLPLQNEATTVTTVLRKPRKALLAELEITSAPPEHRAQQTESTPGLQQGCTSLPEEWADLPKRQVCLGWGWHFWKEFRNSEG